MGRAARAPRIVGAACRRHRTRPKSFPLVGQNASCGSYGPKGKLSLLYLAARAAAIWARGCILSAVRRGRSPGRGDALLPNDPRPGPADGVSRLTPGPSNNRGRTEVDAPRSRRKETLPRRDEGGRSYVSRSTTRANISSRRIPPHHARGPRHHRGPAYGPQP